MDPNTWKLLNQIMTHMIPNNWIRDATHFRQVVPSSIPIRMAPKIGPLAVRNPFGACAEATEIQGNWMICQETIELNYVSLYTGWWVGTVFIFHILGIIPLDFHIYRRA